MVVLGAAIANMGNQAIVSVFGLVYGFQISNTSYGIEGAALVLNISCMVTNFSGLLTGPILKRYSPRVVTAIGVLLTASGLILSSFASSLWHFFLTFSVFAGLGLGLIMPASFMAVNSYFDTRKGQAVGLAMAGTGLGQTFMPQIVTSLQEAFDYNGTVLIMGAISLHGLIGALMFEPVERHLKTVVDGDDVDDLKHSTEVVIVEKKSEEIALLQSQKHNASEVKRYSGNVENTQCSDVTNNNNTEMDMKNTPTRGGEISPLKRISSALDLHLLGDATFVHIIIGLSVVYTSSIAFSMLFPFHLRQIGFATAETASCMSALSAADITARFTIPKLARRVRIGYRTTFLFGALVLACCRAVLAMQTSFPATVAASALCGYVRAATVINQNLTVSEYCENNKGSHLASALGLNMVSKGIFVLTLGQFFAWARAPTGSYVSCILIQSAFLLAVALSWGGEMVVLRRRRAKSSLPAPSTAAAAS